jgi:hypothetical protein
LNSSKDLSPKTLRPILFLLCCLCVGVGLESREAAGLAPAAAAAAPSAVRRLVLIWLSKRRALLEPEANGLNREGDDWLSVFAGWALARAKRRARETAGRACSSHRNVRGVTAATL